MAEEDHASSPLADAPVTISNADTTASSLANFADDTPATASTLGEAEPEHSSYDEGFPMSEAAPANLNVRICLPSAWRLQKPRHMWLGRC